MGQIRKITRLSVLLLVLTLLLAPQAAAAEGNGNLWMRQISTDDGVTFYICADSAVASGVITVKYHVGSLSFRELTVESDYVLAHAVNSKNAGAVQISWIAPADVVAEEGHILMALTFTGKKGESISFSGDVYNAAGEPVAISILDVTELTSAMEAAEALQSADYTADSFAALQTVLSQTDALLEQIAITPAQLDAALQEVNGAVSALVRLQPEPEPTGPEPTEPAPTEPGPVIDVTGDGWIGIIIAFGVICVVGAVVAVVIIKKRGNR